MRWSDAIRLDRRLTGGGRSLHVIFVSLVGRRERKYGAHARARVIRGDFQCSGEILYSFAHPGDADAGSKFTRSAVVAALALILHIQPSLFVIGTDANAGGLAPGVAVNV